MSSHPLGKSAFDLAGMLPLGFVCGLGAAGADACALTSFDSEFGLFYAWGCLSLFLMEILGRDLFIGCVLTRN